MKKIQRLIVIIPMILFFTVLSFSWTSPKRLTYSVGDSTTPAVVIDSGDNILIIYADDSFTFPNTEVFFKKSTDGGATWSSPKRLTFSSGNTYNPGIAINPSNHIFAIWEDDSSGNFEIYFKKSQDGGTTWSAPFRLTWSADKSYNAAIAIDSNGIIHVVWTEYAPGNMDLYHRSSSNSGTSWSARHRLTWGNTGSSPDIAVDSTNNLHLVWSGYVAAIYGREVFHKKSTNIGVTWSTPKRLTYGSTDEWWKSNPKIDINADNLHITWIYYYFRLGFGWYGSNVYYKYSPDGGSSWGGITRITYLGSNTSSFYIQWVDIAADNGNNPHLVWENDQSGIGQIYYKKSTNSGTTWQPHTRLTYTANNCYHPVLDVNFGGTVNVLYQNENPGNYEIYHKKD